MNSSQVVIANSAHYELAFRNSYDLTLALSKER